MNTSILTMDENHFYLNGTIFDLASGDFHYFRTLPGGWRHRLQLMKAFGLNTVQTYVPWNLHEPEREQYDFTGHRNLRAFLALCAEMGMYVMLRPSPYICSECDFGGLPYWLINEHCDLRTSDPAFTQLYAAYFARLAEEFLPMLSTRGGPIIAVAVENEYGSYGTDLTYIRWIAELYRKTGIDVPLYNTDGATAYMLHNGGPADIWSGVNVGALSESSVTAWRQYQSGFPLYIGELWGGRAQQWGGKFARQSAAVIAKRYRDALELGAHVNFYMFCGGTNFGFFSGANHGVFREDVPDARKRYIPFATSYDVDAPITEDGRPTEKYRALRSVLAAHRGIEEASLPPIPENPPVQTAGTIRWEASRDVFHPAVLEALTERRVSSPGLRTMEELGQDYGYILYSTQIPATNPDYMYSIRLNGLRGWADIYLDGVYLGSYYQDRDNSPITFRISEGEARLDILVENLGRIGYGNKLLDTRQGIAESVQLNQTSGILMNWDIRTLPFRYAAFEQIFEDSIPAERTMDTPTPTLYRGHFTAEPGVDTFLQFAPVPGMTRGQVWINGFAIGRYWNIGPQQALYVPGELLREDNRIEVLELYGTADAPAPCFRDTPLLDGLSANAEVVV